MLVPVGLPVGGSGVCLQVRRRDSGADGGRELCGGVPVCWRPERQTAGNQLAERVLHHHRPQVNSP